MINWDNLEVILFSVLFALTFFFNHFYKNCVSHTMTKTVLNIR